ncbi:MAG: HAD-IA family hydrolase [Acidobacteria bacterium]|nr:HAD-IA family hydrolase [Acidobacteriota bacterium]
MNSVIDRDIQVVFFDAAGTLFEVNGSVGEIYCEFTRRYGVQVDQGEINAAFSRSFQAQPPLAFPPETPQAELTILEKTWWRNLVLEVFGNHEFSQFDSFFTEVFEFFRRKEAWRLYDDVIPTLTELRNRSIRLAVISNFDSRLDNLLLDFEIDRLFDGLHISSRIGSAKPDREIFLAALRYHQVEPGRALHVGDSLREDFEGASAAGLRAVLLDRAHTFVEDQHPARITRLDRLIN